LVAELKPEKFTYLGAFNIKGSEIGMLEVGKLRPSLLTRMIGLLWAGTSGCLHSQVKRINHFAITQISLLEHAGGD
jgi:hypothetical protein